jgi:hypothetical protein
MGDESKTTRPERALSRTTAARVRLGWFTLIVVSGLGFGLIGDRRPFGSDPLAHPVAVFFVVVASSLLILRIALARPVPDLIPERALMVGCLLGAAAFLAGNWLATHVLTVS